MIKATLATLNCDFDVLSSDNLESHLQFLRDELRKRTRLISGGGYGIVDNEDPQLIVANTIKPLWPTFSDTSNGVVRVSTGRAVTPAGDILDIFDYYMETPVAGQTGELESVILLRYEEVDSGEIGYNSDGVAVSVGKVARTSLTSMLKSAFLDPTITTAEDMSHLVVVGVVQWSMTSAPKIYTTQENGYRWNRPWFSPNDVEHRNQIGTGVVTTTNPHGTSINDLAGGGGTHVYDHLTNSGMLLSQPVSTPGIPGVMCYDEFDSARILRDNTSTKTAGSWFSGFGVRYVELSRYPTVVHKAVDSTGNEIAIDHIPGTRTCVLVTDTDPALVTIYYTATASLAIDSVSANAISFTQVQGKDLAITKGLAVTTVQVPTVPLRKYSSVPREVTFKLSAAGQVFADPSVILASRGVQESAGTAILLNSKLPVPGVVGVGLMGLPSLVASSCAFVIQGVDADGININETLYFDNTNYADADMIPAEAEAPQQVHFTQQVFASVTSILIPNTGSAALDSVGSATFILLSRADYADARNAVLASGFWDGQQLKDIRDTRRILPVVRDGYYGYSSLVQAAEVVPGVNHILGLGNRAQLLMAEDFAQPVYLDATSVTWDGLGTLDVPVISENLVSSDKITRCYRSRAVPMRVDPAAPLRLIVTLFGADPVANIIGAVRVVGVNRSGRSAEAVMIPAVGDNTGSVFVAFDAVPWSSVSIVVSGRCKGFAAYFLRPENSEPSYFVRFV